MCIRDRCQLYHHRYRSLLLQRLRTRNSSHQQFAATRASNLGISKGSAHMVVNSNNNEVRLRNASRQSDVYRSNMLSAYHESRTRGSRKDYLSSKLSSGSPPAVSRDVVTTAFGPADAARGSEHETKALRREESSVCTCAREEESEKVYLDVKIKGRNRQCYWTAAPTSLSYRQSSSHRRVSSGRQKRCWPRTGRRYLSSAVQYSEGKSGNAQSRYLDWLRTTSMTSCLVLTG